MNLIPGLFFASAFTQYERTVFFAVSTHKKKDPDQTGSLNPFSGMRLFLRQKR